MAKVELYVNGMIYGGWKRASIQRGIEQIAGQFELAVSERWPGQPAKRPIHAGDACEVRVEGETVITGFVDDVGMSYDDKTHEISFRGRDLTGQLVDCSAPTKQWIAGMTLEQIATEVCKPYGTGVTVSADVGDRFAPRRNNEGESVFEMLTDLAKQRGVLLISDGRGNLVITRAGTTKVSTSLVSGQNILRADLQSSIREWYHDYVVKAQPAGDGTFEDPKATVTDTSNPRAERNLLIVTSEFDSPAMLDRRADWEMRTRAAQAHRVTVTVQGWMHAAGIWQPNTLVRLTDEILGIDRDLLIAGVTLTLDDQGTRTDLDLAMPEAFDLIAIPKDGIWSTL